MPHRGADGGSGLSSAIVGSDGSLDSKSYMKCITGTDEAQLHKHILGQCQLDVGWVDGRNSLSVIV